MVALIHQNIMNVFNTSNRPTTLPPYLFWAIVTNQLLFALAMIVSWLTYMLWRDDLIGDLRNIEVSMKTSPLYTQERALVILTLLLVDISTIVME